MDDEDDEDEDEDEEEEIPIVVDGTEKEEVETANEPREDL